MAERGSERRRVNLGIDFGTRFTRVTYFDPVTQETGRLRLGLDQRGFREYAVPSLAVRAEGRWLFGYEAERYMDAGRWAVPPTPVWSLKRRLGKPDPEGTTLAIDGETFSVSSVIADFLRYVLKLAEPVLKARYPQAKFDALPMNLSVPVLFDDRARRKIAEIYAEVFGSAAGDKLIINEPTAAGMAEYKAPQRFPDGGIAVFDAGAGTTDVTILNKVGDHLLVVESDAAAVGGDDIDAVLAEVIEHACRARGVDPTTPSVAKLWAIERPKVTRLKERLSEEEDVEEVFTLGEHQVPFRYSSSDLERRVMPIAKRMVDVLSGALTRARRQFDQTRRPFHLKEVLVVGGSSYVPVLRRQLDRAVRTWVAETRQTYGNPSIRHVMSLPGASEDAALFAVALGTAYPAQNFEEISLGRVPYDTELVLGKQPAKVLKLLDAYASLPAEATGVKVGSREFFPYEGELRFLQNGAVRQAIQIKLDLRPDRHLDVDIEWRLTLAADGRLALEYSTSKGRRKTRVEQKMPWHEFIARRVADVHRFYHGSSKYQPHGGFLSEGHGDGSPG
jgi:actin-like ATPase involved in cell morphogenesis